VGPMARTVADCAVMLGAIAGYDPRDATTSVLPVPDYRAALTGDVKGLRIGLLRRSFLDGSTPDVAAAVEQAAKTLESAGARIDEVSLPHMELIPAATYAIIAAEALAYHATWLRTRAADYQTDVRERLKLGVFVTGEDYVRAQRIRALVRDAVDEALRTRDVLLAPSTPIVAPRLDETHVDIRGERIDARSALIRLTRPFNFSGHPTCALPCGFTAAGLPIGMQIIGRPFDEATTLRAGDTYQRATDWHQRRPPRASL